MKFPILIHLLNNKAKHIVMSFEELPKEHYFRIVQTGINPNDMSNEIEVTYRRVDVTEMEEVTIDLPTQENNEPSVSDSSDDGASSSGEDSSSPSS